MRAARLLLASLLLAALPAAGQSPVPLTPEAERAANEAMSRLRSPYTYSHTVDMCPSAGALRDSIRVAAASGMTSGEIVEDVISRHGEQLRLLPRRSGAGLWVWLMPPLAILAGLAAIVAWMRRGRSGAAASPAPAAPQLREEERARVAAALRSWESGGEVEP